MEDESRDFTPWLAKSENLAVLADALGLGLELEAEQVPVGPYFADIVAKETDEESRVIIEAQLTKTDHTHLGQIITYASGRQAKIMIWIAKEFAAEHQQAITFLNENGSGDLQFYGVEIELLQIGNSPFAPHFKVVARPNDYLEEVKEERILGPDDLLYLEFWNGFKKFCGNSGSSLSFRGPRPKQLNVVRAGLRKGIIRLSIGSGKRIRYSVRLSREIKRDAFRQLEADKAAIEAETGPLVWNEQTAGISLLLGAADLEDKSAWPSLFEGKGGIALQSIRATARPIARRRRSKRIVSTSFTKSSGFGRSLRPQFYLGLRGCLKSPDSVIFTDYVPPFHSPSSWDKP